MEKAVDKSSCVEKHTESGGHNSDSGSTSSHCSYNIKSSSGFKPNSVAAQREDIAVKVKPFSCTDSDSLYWEVDMPGIQNTEPERQNKANRRHQNANGTLLSSAASLVSQLPQKDKKRKMKDISESGRQIYCGVWTSC
jgi:hypothetical protein